MVNEFEEMYNSNEFNNEKPIVENNSTPTTPPVTAPDGDTAVVQNPSNDGTSNDGTSNDDTAKAQSYDFSKASKSAKGPDRINMDGKIVTITNITLDIPSVDSEWEFSKDKKTKMKSCIFKVFYDNDGQFEYYSGLKVFDNTTKEGVFKYSEPSLQEDEKFKDTQARLLKKACAAFLNKKISQVSMNDFYKFLLSKPKAKLVSMPFEYDNEITNKNMVAEFI